MLRLLMMLCALCVWARAVSGVEAADGTVVTVRKGTVRIDRDGDRARLTAGQEAHLTDGAPVQVKGSEVVSPPPSEPMAVQWEPGQTVVMADRTGILLRASTEGSEGRSADGEYAARLNAEGELQVADLKHDRMATRLPDGTWVHRFAGCEMRVEPSGRTALRRPDGRELTTVEAPPAPVADSTPAPVPAARRNRWKVGVHLDKTALGLRVKSVSPDSPAEVGGFKAGDEIVAIGEQKDPTLEQIQERLQQVRTGEKIPFTVRRGDRTVTLTVVAGAWE